MCLLLVLHLQIVLQLEIREFQDFLNLKIPKIPEIPDFLNLKIREIRIVLEHQQILLHRHQHRHHHRHRLTNGFQV